MEGGKDRRTWSDVLGKVGRECTVYMECVIIDDRNSDI